MNSISKQEFAEVLATLPDTAIAIDVRTPTEFAERSIAGVRNVPLDSLAEYDYLFKESEIVYIHCKTGRRAQLAAEQIEQQWNVQTYVYEGGIADWFAEEL